MIRPMATWILIAMFATTLTGCTSEASRERQQQAEARRKVAEEDQDLQAQEGSEEAQRALVLKEQEKLDTVEQKRTNNVYAHSCRKVTSVNYVLNANGIDTSQCSPEQLKIEQEAERRQVFDKAFEQVKEHNRSQDSLDIQTNHDPR